MKRASHGLLQQCLDIGLYRRLRLGGRHRFCDGDHGAPGEFTIV